MLVLPADAEMDMIGSEDLEDLAQALGLAQMVAMDCNHVTDVGLKPFL